MQGTSWEAAPWARHGLSVLLGLVILLLGWYAPESEALPIFARQTGQNCVACHAGGQFPELTPYGRAFKLTGYTLGERTALPVAFMAVLTGTKVRNTNDPNGNSTADFPAKNRSVIFNTASLFLGGKITDNLGAFIQVTNNNYDHLSQDGVTWKNKFYSDNTDLRYADRLIGENHDLIFGFSVNNNPSVSDVWNSAPAWGYDVVPASAWGGAVGKIPQSPMLAGALAQKVVGLSSYAYWNKMVYAEFAAYRTANNSLSALSRGYTTRDQSLPLLSGITPYWRLALTHEWGAHNAMLGVMGLSAKQHTDATDSSSPTWKYNDIGIDAQYQYLLDPHTVTTEVSYLHERIHYDSATAGQPGAYDAAFATTLQSLSNSSDTLGLFRVKTAYTYQAKYGGSIAFFNLTGSYNSARQTGVGSDPTGGDTLPSLSNNITGKPDTRGWTMEVFWLPVQYARVGLQYTLFNRYQGASNNYDGWGRRAKDNNTVFFYVWGSY
ncbi:hypothetical protein [Uliginosibacterium gangwonense]|uniref:hypothetical protein n=1 Tax=Uliginosibacterium gangwonense TaxID=392736 RepID=UPI000364E1AB|nr:hypothetical protein [Uliginosibacterium gangwonense]